eukprot:CCRYP_015394-RC/>CCRYP_015394-RC protein AED:0.06 eAED:0.06 QI:168/1/1/1/0.85/0.76/21/3141/1947
MSISDNEEAATAAASKQSAKSPPRKMRHRRHASSERVEKLSVQEVAEVSRRRVQALLQRHAESPDVHHDEPDIAVIPSLVSLSRAFFQGDPADSHPPITEAPVDLAASLPALSPPHAGDRGFVPTLRPREWAPARSPTRMGASLPPTPPPATPPIGPQGAPVPSHLLRTVPSQPRASLDDTQYAPPASPNTRRILSNGPISKANIQLSAPGRLGGNSSRFADAAWDVSAQQRSQQPWQQQRLSTQQEPRYINAVQSLVDAVARLEARLKEAESTASSAPAAAAASHGNNNSSSSNNNNNPSTYTQYTPKQSTLHRDNIDELEADTITKLAEIMLHPPVRKVVQVDDSGAGDVVLRYLWERDATDDDVHNYQDEEHDSNYRQVVDENIRQMEVEYNNDVADEEEHTTIDSKKRYKRYPDVEPILKSRYPDAQSAHASVVTLGLSIPRRVCQHPFRRNDIVWVCRTCQSDETCVLCHDCFTHSNHEGHDVAFYHAQAGGCCDCGDADAWDPKGFCSKHGGARGAGAPPGSAVASVEPSVLGAVHACADWLVGVVRDGVEGGYRRANPALFVVQNGEDNAKFAGLGRSESSLVDCEREDSIDIRRRMNLRRQESLHRRNTVADVETMHITRSDEEEETEEDDVTLLPDTEDAKRIATDIVHEVQFNPTAASSSKKWDSKPQSSSDTGNASQVFDPEAAGSRAAKKAKAPPETLPEKSPARALGDLGRKEQGLFLVLHADDIRVGAHQPTEVIEALKELFSSPGGAGRQDVVGAPSTMRGLASSSLSAASFIPRPLGPRLTPRLGFEGDGRNNRYLFRAPPAEATLTKVVRLVQKHGNVIVWGTQELLAECGDVVARCWRDGDPASSAMVGAAMLNRAKILTDRGLVCSIKTHRNLINDQKATAIIRLIASVAQSCDPLCDQVSLGLSGSGISPTLNAIIRSDLKLPCKFTTSWHALLLTLLAQPEFKAALAVAYCDTYRAVTQEYARGVGVVERSSFTLSVQFLNRVTYVIGLVRDRNLLSKLSKSLLETMRSASFIPGSPGSPPPAGASNEILLHSSSLHTESSSLAAILMALLGYFSTGGDEEYVLLELDNELNNVMNDLGEHFTGGDSRHHGRSAMPRGAKEDFGHPSKHHRIDSFIKRTAALVNPTLNPTHPFLQHRRYSPCISDLKCVLNVKGMSRIFLSLPNPTDCPSSATLNDGNAFDNWIKVLALGQWMDGQVWRSWDMGHVESEPRGWVGAFNTSISLGSVYERLLNWEDSDPCIIEDKSIRLLSCVEVAHYALTAGVHRWQRSEMLSYRSTPSPSSGLNVPPYALCPATVPFSTVASAHGSTLAMSALPLSQIQTWSFHLPLHRFVAACIREVSRRHDVTNNTFGGGGIAELLRMFKVPGDISSLDAVSQLRLNSLLFRGLMEFPVIVLSRAAQIRAGIWRRNGPGMTDQVLNYSEPPFCKALQDSDILLVQFSLICQQSSNLITKGETNNQMGRLAGSVLSQAHGTSRLVNLLLHRFGVFDFLGFESAPSKDTHQYMQEIEAGFYPAESQATAGQEVPPNSRPFPWVYSPAKDFATSIRLVEELLTLLIILITDIPSPPPQCSEERAMEAKRRLRREVIHRLVSGPKTHSEMAEVHHILPLRDNLVLCDEGKLINPDDASGAALESVLNDVATRKTRIGDADQWELKKRAWEEYDPSFHRISTRAHQCATEHRPKQIPGHCSPYAPKPTPAHDSFKRIRRDLTADASVLAIVYRVLHAYCYAVDSPKSTAELRGREMYEKGTKSETALARAVHILTLGAFAWEETLSSFVSCTDLGGGDIGSVFYQHQVSRVAPNAREWVEMALLRSPDKVMMSSWYLGEENTLLLLKRVASEAAINDSSLKSGATWLCDFAAKWNSTAATLLGRGSSTVTTTGRAVSDAQDELEKRKALAKARQQQAMERMKAQICWSLLFDVSIRMS